MQMPCENRWHVNKNTITQVLSSNYIKYGTTASHSRDVAIKMETSHQYMDLTSQMRAELLSNDLSMF